MSQPPPAPLWATLDRFERDAQGRRLAVIVFDDEQQLVLPESVLPPGSKRGDVLALSLRLDTAETRARGDSISVLQRKLFGD